MRLNTLRVLAFVTTLMVVILSAGRSFAEEGNYIEMSGVVQSMNEDQVSLVINDMEFQVNANVRVNGVHSPKAYLFGLLNVGDKVAITAQFHDNGQRTIVALESR